MFLPGLKKWNEVLLFADGMKIKDSFILDQIRKRKSKPLKAL